MVTITIITITIITITISIIYYNSAFPQVKPSEIQSLSAEIKR